jgi:hypothetical protein
MRFWRVQAIVGLALTQEKTFDIISDDEKMLFDGWKSVYRKSWNIEVNLVGQKSGKCKLIDPKMQWKKAFSHVSGQNLLGNYQYHVTWN